MPLFGFLFSPFRSMVTLYTSKHLLMQYVSVMGRDQLTFPPTVLAFPAIKHNELHDAAANLLPQVCTNVQVEPHLQPLSSESLSRHISNTDDHARLDINYKRFLEHFS